MRAVISDPAADAILEKAEIDTPLITFRHFRFETRLHQLVTDRIPGYAIERIATGLSKRGLQRIGAKGSRVGIGSQVDLTHLGPAAPQLQVIQVLQIL